MGVGGWVDNIKKGHCGMLMASFEKIYIQLVYTVYSMSDTSQKSKQFIKY